MPNKKQSALDRSMPDQKKQYEIGYAKPPRENQFQPGQSGNPHGRPKGRQNKKPALNEERLKSIILEEAYRSVKVNDGDKQVSVPMAQAIVRSMAVNAAKGNTRAQRLFSEMLAATETANKHLHDQWLDTAMEYKIQWDREIERCERQGLPIPEPIPHPDHIQIDMRTGQVRITGPFTKEDKAELEMWEERKAHFRQKAINLRQDLENTEPLEDREEIQAELETAEKLVEKICIIAPD
ncbi:MAG: DUF5681 domain-containing protein [Pseudomonadota bacterium]